MARKHKHPEHENLERWLVSYADFMTLLFATFTALYALAQTDAAKLKDVGQAIREGFEEQSILSGIKSVIQGQSAPTRNPDPLSSDKGAGPGILGKFDSMTYQPGEVKSVKKLARQLMNDLADLNRKIEAENRLKSLGGAQGKGKEGTPKEDPEAPIRPIEASVQERGIRISFDSRLLFAPGSATLQAAGLSFLDSVAVRLKKYDNNRIHVEGHTDNQAIATTFFPSNWELSTARASSVVRYLIRRQQFNPASMVAVGYADTQPLAANNTPAGRSHNRRVDIILYSARVSMLLNPRVQYLKEKALTSRSEMPQKAQKVEALPSKNPGGNDGLVKVIIREKDGTERILIPKTRSGKENKPDGNAPHDAPNPVNKSAAHKPATHTDTH